MVSYSLTSIHITDNYFRVMLLPKGETPPLLNYLRNRENDLLTGMLFQSSFTKHLNILCSPHGWLLIGCTAFVLYHVFSKPFGRVANLSSFCLLRIPDLLQPDPIQSSLLLPLPQWENYVTHQHAAGGTAPSCGCKQRFLGFRSIFRLCPEQSVTKLTLVLREVSSK